MLRVHSPRKSGGLDLFHFLDGVRHRSEVVVQVRVRKMLVDMTRLRSATVGNAGAD